MLVVLSLISESAIAQQMNVDLGHGWKRRHRMPELLDGGLAHNSRSFFVKFATRKDAVRGTFATTIFAQKQVYRLPQLWVWWTCPPLRPSDWKLRVLHLNDAKEITSLALNQGALFSLVFPFLRFFVGGKVPWRNCAQYHSRSYWPACAFCRPNDSRQHSFIRMRWAIDLPGMYVPLQTGSERSQLCGTMYQ